MSGTQVFVLVNILGGISVLSSYAICIALYPESRAALWGGVEGSWKTIFTVSMLPASIGYIAFCFSVISKYADVFSDFLGTYTLGIICAFFLISATFWMPATIAYIKTQQPLWWFVTVSSLWITALSLVSLTVVVFYIYIAKDASLFHKYLVLTGLTYITLHCLVLDGIIWVSKFPKFNL